MKPLSCLICGQQIIVRPAQGRKSKKSFLLLKCSVDARHFRCFISDQAYVKSVIDQWAAAGDTPQLAPTGTGTGGR